MSALVGALGGAGGGGGGGAGGGLLAGLLGGEDRACLEQAVKGEVLLMRSSSTYVLRVFHCRGVWSLVGVACR